MCACSDVQTFIWSPDDLDLKHMPWHVPETLERWHSGSTEPGAQQPIWPLRCAHTYDIVCKLSPCHVRTCMLQHSLILHAVLLDTARAIKLVHQQARSCMLTSTMMTFQKQYAQLVQVAMHLPLQLFISNNIRLGVLPWQSQAQACLRRDGVLPRDVHHFAQDVLIPRLQDEGLLNCRLPGEMWSLSSSSLMKLISAVCPNLHCLTATALSAWPRIASKIV